MGFILSLIGDLLGRLKFGSLSRLAKSISFIFFDILRFRHQIVLKNLRIAFSDSKSEQEILQIARASFYHFVLTLLEFLASRRQDISANVEIVGRQHITAALAENKGVYVLCCHLGSWEAMGSAFTRFIVPAHVLVKKVGNGSVNHFVESLRQHNDFLTVKRAKKGDGYEAIKQILANKQVVGFVMDQARPGEPRLPFFGKPAKTNTSLAAIWRRNPAPIVPVFLVRKSDGSKTMTILPALEIHSSTDSAQDILDHSLLFNRTVEDMVRSCPDQYFWLHDRWK